MSEQRGQRISVELNSLLYCDTRATNQVSDSSSSLRHRDVPVQLVLPDGKNCLGLPLRENIPVAHSLVGTQEDFLVRHMYFLELFQK